MRGCDKLVTIWRRDKNNFERDNPDILCRWSRRAERKLDGAVANARESVSIIIPYDTGFKIAPGDLIALGTHELEITGEKPCRESDIKQELGADIITVRSVSYNLDGRSPHMRLEG